MGASDPGRPRGGSLLLALLAFDLRGGGRLAVQAAAPVVAAGVGAAVILAGGFPTQAVAMLFGEAPSPGARMLLVPLALGFASMAVPRVCHGRAGWLRHLPVSGRALRLAALLAAVVAQAPPLVALGLLARMVTKDPLLLLGDLLGLALAAASAALALMPVERRRVAAPLALAASALSVVDRSGLLPGAALLLVAERIAGPLAPRSTGPRLPASASPAGPARLGLRIAWRALRTRLLLAYLASAVPLAAGGLFVANNDLSAPQQDLALRLAFGVAVVTLLASLAHALAVRRPAWPWARSLPWSAGRRTRADAVLMGAGALPLLALCGALSPGSAAPVLGVLPLVAALAAGAVRRAPERRGGAVGEVLVAGLFAAGSIALVPLLAAAALAATPWAIAGAAERERGLRVSRWLDRHHLAVGDPEAWSA